MTFMIQLRCRQWPESMGWQDTDFVPDDCTPAEWVAKMNDGDPQIEYRVVAFVDGRMMLGLDRCEVEVVVSALNKLGDDLKDHVAWGSRVAERRLAVVRTVLARIRVLSH
jgi:hypothetical protein